jgi:hypothetical protein
MKSPDCAFALEFRSVPTGDVREDWIVRLHFPAGAGADDLLPLTARDGRDVPIETGTFAFMGCMCPLAAGSGSIRYRDFVAGIHEKAVWLLRPGQESVPGVLTFA